MNFIVRTRKPSEMRYQTVGDWQQFAMHTEIDVADSGNADSNFLVALHEMIEAYLCIRKKVDPKAVDDFDKGWNDHLSPYDEPGDDPAAPYHAEHVFATNVERLVAAQLGLNWYKHAENVEAADDAVSEALSKSPRLA